MNRISLFLRRCLFLLLLVLMVSLDSTAQRFDRELFLHRIATAIGTFTPWT